MDKLAAAATFVVAMISPLKNVRRADIDMPQEAVV